MIPRYAATYSWGEFGAAALECSVGDPRAALASRLTGLFDTRHVFLFRSASAALCAALRAYSRPGGVLMPAYICVEVPEAVCYAGYRPVFVDIDYQSLNATAAAIEQAFTTDTTVVLATHLFGVPCQIDEILDIGRRRHALVVEDVAPALGATFGGTLVGRLGDCAIVSFHSTKVVSAGGGGALITDNHGLAQAVRAVIRGGLPPDSNWNPLAKTAIWKLATHRYCYGMLQRIYTLLRGEAMFEKVTPQLTMPAGFLRGCSPFSASLAAAQLSGLEANLKRRRALAEMYMNQLRNAAIGHPRIPSRSEPAWIQYSVTVEDRAAFYRHMRSHGIDLSWTYRYCSAESFGQDGFPNARLAAQTVLGLPTYPSLSDEQGAKICRVVRAYRPTVKTPVKTTGPVL